MAGSSALTFSTQDDSLVCIFVGRLDTQTCSAVEADLLARVAAAEGAVLFDLSGVDYVASMFFRLCLQVTREVGAERFGVTNVQPTLKKVFKVAGLDAMIH